MKGDPDNIIISDDDASDHEEFMSIHHPEPKAKAVPVKKKAVTMADVPRDRGSDPARKLGYRNELDYYAGKIGPDTRTTRAARHAKPGGIVHGDYPATPTGPANGGKHGKPWNGRD